MLRHWNILFICITVKSKEDEEDYVLWYTFVSSIDKQCRDSLHIIIIICRTWKSYTVKCVAFSSNDIFQCSQHRRIHLIRVSSTWTLFLVWKLAWESVCEIERQQIFFCHVQVFNLWPVQVKYVNCTFSHLPPLSSCLTLFLSFSLCHVRRAVCPSLRSRLKCLQCVISTTFVPSETSIYCHSISMTVVTSTHFF